MYKRREEKKGEESKELIMSRQSNFAGEIIVVIIGKMIIWANLVLNAAGLCYS